MTKRKPSGTSFETWIDRQIREAEERGAFDDLAGAGKPLPRRDQPFTIERWRQARQEAVPAADRAPAAEPPAPRARWWRRIIRRRRRPSGG